MTHLGFAATAMSLRQPKASEYTGFYSTLWGQPKEFRYSVKSVVTFCQSMRPIAIQYWSRDDRHPVHWNCVCLDVELVQQ